MIDRLPMQIENLNPAVVVVLVMTPEEVYIWIFRILNVLACICKGGIVDVTRLNH